MPRLSNQLYLDRHRFLAKAWTDFQRLYTILPAQEQWQVHAFYQPTKDLTDDQLLLLLEHRETISKEKPHLPAQAGKCFTRMNHAFRVAYEHAHGDERRFHEALWQFTDARAMSTATHGKRQIRVTALARSEPDLGLFAKALIAMAEDQLAAERDAA